MRIINKIQCSFYAAALASSSTISAKVFEGKDGLVVMEAESTKSTLGKWKKKTDVKEFTGESHLEFTGNKPANGPPTSPLKYEFKVDKEGQYDLMIRGFKRLEGEEHDKCNDVYVKLKGDFESAGDAPIELLKKETKLFGGHHEKWGWAMKLDEGHKKYNPSYKLKAGETYTLTIYGRSQRFNIDRIILKHVSVKRKAAQNAKLVESKSR